MLSQGFALDVVEKYVVFGRGTRLTSVCLVFGVRSIHNQIHENVAMSILSVLSIVLYDVGPRRKDKTSAINKS